jgi:hypothetical protein
VFVARLFDKDPPTARSADLPLPYSSENPHPSVRVIVILIILQPVTDIFCWLAIQDLYPNREVDAELSNEDNIGQKEPVGDDAKDKGAPLVEALAPNSIGSNLAGEARPSTRDHTTTAAPLGVGKRKKRVVLETNSKQDHALADQVIIKLPPYHGPRGPLGLVVVENIFGTSLKLFDSRLRLQELALRLVWMSSLQKGLERRH